MWHEAASQPFVDHIFFIETHNIVLTQHARNALVHLQIQVRVALARFNRGNQLLLMTMHITDQRSKIILFTGVGTGDIGDITVKGRARIQQEAVAAGGGFTLQGGVVQNRAMLIQGHNIGVRHLSITLTGSRQIRQVDIKLAHAGHKGIVRCAVAIDGNLLGAAHTLQLVISFVSALIMQRIK